jgi:hypothetical protein
MLRFGIETLSTLRRRPERAAITAAPATPARAAPPAIIGTFAFWATVATPCAAFWAPVLTVSATPLPAERLLRDPVERARFPVLLRAALEPLREAVLLREPDVLREPADRLDPDDFVDPDGFVDPARFVLVLVWAMGLSPPWTACLLSATHRFAM